MWEGVGDRTELHHIDPPLYWPLLRFFPVLLGYSTWSLGPSLSGTCSSIQHLISSSSVLQTNWISCAPSYIIVRRPPFCGHHKSHSFNPSTVKVIFWYSSTGCTCYLHRCSSYFDSPAGSEVNIQDICIYIYRCVCVHIGGWTYLRRCVYAYVEYVRSGRKWVGVDARILCMTHSFICPSLSRDGQIRLRR